MDRNRLFWASRRGMLELDLILMPFLDHVYPTLEEADQRRYQRLLDCEDQEMFGWFLHRQEPEDPDLRKIVRIIRESRRPQP
jgi:antitoxin CptB